MGGTNVWNIIGSLIIAAMVLKVLWILIGNDDTWSF